MESEELVEMKEVLRILEREHTNLCYKDYKRGEEEPWMSKVFEVSIRVIKEKLGKEV